MSNMEKEREMIEMIEIPGKNYELGKYAVTQSQWLEIMGNNPSGFTGDLQRPVETVSWHDAQDFITKLNKITGRGYRLPTEEEWEYACFCGGLPASTGQVLERAWCWENSEKKTHPVGQKQANDYGLYGMLGNTWEWTATDSGRNKVLRGGSWSFSAKGLHAALRGSNVPVVRLSNVGFRLARTITPNDSNTKKEREMTDLEATRLKLKCLEMTENTNLPWWEVIRYRGQPCYINSCFPGDLGEYKIALGLIEGKPVWPDSEVYSTVGSKCFANELPSCVPLSSYSWTPPKPTTLTIELNADDVEYWAKLYRQIEAKKYYGSCADYSLRFYAACQKALETIK